MARYAKFKDRLQLSLPSETKKTFNRICDEKRKSMNETIREFIEEYIEREEAKGKPQ